MKIAALMTLACSIASAQNLMPWPAKITAGQGWLLVSGLRIELAGAKDGRLERAAARLPARLARRTGIPPGGAAEATLVIDCTAIGEDESYTLDVTERQARLAAPATLGALRGMETFLQLVEPGSDGFRAPAVHIEDQPRFPWRGLLIDVSRHWMPAEVIRRNLDAMAAVKLNVLHWHLSDDQGFRVESLRYPRLQEAGSDGNFYRQDEIRDIIAYAADRGIRVVPEFDMPAHTAAWLVGYPELAPLAGPYQIVRTWGVSDPCIDPTREEVYAFLDGFVGEMAALFPGEYFHIGGDEVNGKQWDASQHVREFKQAHGMKTNDDLQAYFNQRLLKIVASHGKKMAGWDEILHPDLPKDVLVQSWRGQKSLAEAARQGYQGILSFNYYLDLMQPASFHYANDPLAGAAASLTDEEKARVLGGEACMWAEYANPETVDSRIWPRMAAIAERFWSPASLTDLDSMYRRLEVVSRELDWTGVTHRSGYPLMLERIMGGRDTEPLRMLADLLEPVKGYARNRGQKYRQSTPLNRLVDAARPESAAAREFSRDVDALLGGNTALDHDVRTRLAAWRDNDARLRPLLADSFLAAEAGPISADVAAVATAALQALDYRGTGKAAPEAWIARQKALLKRAAEPRSELLIMIVPAAGRLVEKAAGPVTTPARKRPPGGRRRR